MTFVPGVIPSDELGTRDAFHVSGVVVTSTVAVSPGQEMFLESSGVYARPVRNGERRHGIVDPFLLSPVPPHSPYLLFMDTARVGVVRHTFDIDGVQNEEAEDDYDDGCGGCNN